MWHSDLTTNGGAWRSDCATLLIGVITDVRFRLLYELSVWAELAAQSVPQDARTFSDPSIASPSVYKGTVDERIDSASREDRHRPSLVAGGR
jgi:hypothetical protein